MVQLFQHKIVYLSGILFSAGAAVDLGLTQN